MADQLSEGVLFDLLTKRRAGKFTADDLLWAVDNIDRLRTIRSEKSEENESIFQRLFGGLDEGSEFKEESFPLEPPSQLRPVIEMQFPEGHELHDVKLMAILKWADSQGLELAPARTTGEYLYERETDAGDLFIGGGIYRNSIGNLVVTCFHCKSDKNECSQFKGHACFRWTNYNYPPRDRKVTWLFVRKWVNWYDEQ